MSFFCLLPRSDKDRADISDQSSPWISVRPCRKALLVRRSSVADVGLGGVVRGGVDGFCLFTRHLLQDEARMECGGIGYCGKRGRVFCFAFACAWVVQCELYAESLARALKLASSHARWSVETRPLESSSQLHPFRPWISRSSGRNGRRGFRRAISTSNLIISHAAASTSAFIYTSNHFSLSYPHAIHPSPTRSRPSRSERTSSCLSNAILPHPSDPSARILGGRIPPRSVRSLPKLLLLSRSLARLLSFPRDCGRPCRGLCRPIS